MTEPIRVLHVIHSLGLGGAERLLVDIVSNTSRGRFRHAVVQLAPPDEYAPTIRPHVAFLDQLHWNRSTGWSHAARGVRRAIRRFEPHIVQSMLFEANIAARLAGMSLPNRPRYLTNAVSLEYDPAVVRVAGWSPVRVAARRVIDATTAALTRSRFVACSHCVAVATRSALHAPARAIRTIYNSVDASTLARNPSESSDLRRSLAIPETAFVFLNLGRLILTKAQDTLLRAFALARRELGDSYLALVGGGPDEPVFQSLSRELGVADRVRFVGRPRSVGPSYGMAQAFVFPSLVEGLSLALIEAMLCGLPSIASDIPANLEVVQDGVTGLAFPAGDEQALAARMVRLRADDGLRQRLGTAGRDFATATFTSAVIMPQWEDLYETLSAMPGSRGGVG